MDSLLVYKASAGSGKTHVLVRHYIAWALHFPSAFKHILALTFTNAATEEIKQRIISHLYDLASGKQTDLWHELCQMGWKCGQLQRSSQAVLTHIVYHYDDFRVTTLDGFFYKLIQSFPKELGLKQNFSLALDEPLVLKTVLAELMVSSDPWLQQWILDFTLERLASGRTWQVTSDIEQLGQTLFAESFKIQLPDLLTVLQQRDGLHYFSTVIQHFQLSFQQKMAQIGERALTILQEHQLEPTHFAYGTQGVIGYFFKLAHKKDFIPSKRVWKALQAVQHWLPPKETSQTAALTSIITQRLYPLLQEAVDLYQQQGSAYRTAMALSRCSYALGMIGSLLQGLAAYRAKHHVWFISDIATLLYHTIKEEEAPFFYEALPFRHFLIDEFQDLSYFQWINIKPLLVNSVAQGYANLLVGDVKQSIYRWRGSSGKILNQQVACAFPQHRLCTLTTNRRSQAAIVLFNNTFFSVAAHALTAYLAATLASFSDSTSASLEDALAQIQKTYADVAQQVSGLPSGQVACFFFPACSWREHVQHELLKCWQQLPEEGDMAVLVRNNREVAALTHLWHGIGQESLHIATLWDHIAVRFLIHTLYYLHDEQDLINKVAWIAAYGSCVDPCSMIPSWYRDFDRDHLIPLLFWEQKTFLQHLSVYACVERLITLFFCQDYPDREVLNFFQSMLLEYAVKENHTIPAFLNWWEKKGKTLPFRTMDHKTRVKIMTIHQAKGLEFDTVVLPFCDWPLDHLHNPPLLWLAGRSLPFAHWPVWPVRYGADLRETHYAPDYYEERIQVHLDNLNVLYVAFTRAKKQLYIMAPLPEQQAAMTTTADLLYQALTGAAFADTIAYKLLMQREEMATGVKFCFSAI